MNDKKTRTLAIIITLIVAFIIGYISISIFEEYGWTLFILIPILIGFLPPFIVGRRGYLSKSSAFKLSFITLGIACLCLLIFAIEGLICIAMASPALALLTLLGSYLAFVFQKNDVVNSTNTTLVLFLVALSSMSFDYLNVPKDLIAVKTIVHIDAPLENVWHNVVTFDKIKEPTDWIFKTGISYPTDATIKGKGIGAVRYCNFTTGSFIEPITTWDEPNLLQFDVQEQPVPMNELNPFWEVHPPHLDGYFKSYKGQFKLSLLDNGFTELEGTTWYRVDIHPVFYWQIWSDFIIHKIHKRVLDHIKKETEKTLTTK